jgi:hypothetical protein
MAYPECEALQKQYLEMRRAVLAFARTLDRFEDRRLAQVDATRPPGAPSIREWRRLMEKQSGLCLPADSNPA